MEHGPVVAGSQGQSCQEAFITTDARSSDDECESRRLTMESISTRHLPTGRLSRFAFVAVLVFVLGATVLARQTRRYIGVKVDSSGKPFRLYEGGLDMPGRADQYNGIDDTREVQVGDNDGSTSVFVIGDWGAVLPDHTTFMAEGSSEQSAQLRVADQIKSRAGWAQPQYVLNAGDNFYIDGLANSCNDPPSDEQWATEDAFRAGWQDIYGEVANIPWLSVLGNHDYGGWRYDHGWPQQIGYSFMNHNWIMPARYFTKRIHHPEFYIDYIMMDSNYMDGRYFDTGRQDRNICSEHNLEDSSIGTCDANGGMSSVQACEGWYRNQYGVQHDWAYGKLAASDARWKVIVTHFPCGHDTDWFKTLKQEQGLDLVVTGHRHQQELWWDGTESGYVKYHMELSEWDGGAPQCVISGGGGGISSEDAEGATYGTDMARYGFFHLTIKRDSMLIELIDWDGGTVGQTEIYPH